MPVKIDSSADLYRKLPSIDELQRRPNLAALAANEGQAAVTDAARAVLASLRQEITDGCLDANAVDLALSGLEDAITRRVRQSLKYSLRSVINATGVILHTNLGRAPLPASTLEHIRETATSYSNLEFELETGERGKRDVHVDRLFRKLLDESVGAGVSARGGEARISTIVVNNNAAAVLLALNTLAEGGEVIVS
jgi:L-seryl-tRNA(Ser) seleniumtransferase